jgi:hypothetical protein
MENIVRTIFGSALQSSLLMGVPHTYPTNTTLNEKFDIQSGVYPAPEILGKMRYWSIGLGGHTLSVGANGVPVPQPVQHRGTDAALYRHRPFVLREINNDLSPAERTKYALRRKETHQGRDYIAYYLRRMDMTNVNVAMELVTIAEGVTTITPFVPTSANLSPVPPVLSNSGVNVVNGEYTSATAKISLLLSELDVAEYINVANVLEEDDNYAIISEVALCSGVDKTVTSPADNNSTINFNEAIAVQVVTFVNVFYPVKFTNTGVNILLDVGASEPNLTLADGA